ncbi:hypothetical protein MES4922_80097 [Mesorhizobium ventifaucium]|uniref:Insertion element IS402-like domain-containing protein n=1 Tax=Mesorhizobium ventifaucium TaxID=666020 RepID=A0ABN8KDM9_9HYPH|nr:hypothetical protein MES4922_80097 [Mesorhizobium ventifaucium]
MVQRRHGINGDFAAKGDYKDEPRLFLADRGAVRRLAALLPTDTRGKRRVDDRRVISGIVHVLKSGGRWVDAPDAYGPRKTLYNRFVRWAAKGIRVDIFHALVSAGGTPAEVRSPADRNLLLNLSAMRRMAEQAQNELLRLAEINRIDVCDYRLIPAADVGYSLPFVAKSFLNYQHLFSQIYDSIRNGVLKERAVIGKEAEFESMLEYGYSYSGSLGVVLLAQSERDFFNGRMDAPIEALFQVIDIEDNHSVRDIASSLGNAVVKRVFDWSAVNVEAKFSADVRWNRSDGRQLGQVVEIRHMERIVDVIGATADDKTAVVTARGMLVGTDLPGRSFHFVVPDGDSYKGSFHPDLVIGCSWQGVRRGNRRG